MKTERKGYQKAVLVIAVFTILAGALYATDNFRKIPQNKSGSSILKRNEHGQGEKNQKLVAKTKDQKAKITVEIQEQSYTQEELQRVFDTAGKKLETLILGENKSLDEVRYDLNLVKTVPDTGIEVSWELSDYQTVNILGELQDKNLSEEGRIIELKALLTYGDAKAEHQFSARVFPPKLDDSGQFQRQLEKKMKEADETDRESGYVVLPDEIEGKTISWHYAKDMRSVGIFVLGIVAAALMLVLEKQNEIQKKKARRHHGGERPHIGCVVQAVPRPSLSGDGTISVTSSVINLTGHKDEFLCRRLAENRCRETGKVVVCTGGVHMDHITGEQIEELLKNIDRMMTE